MRIRSCVPAVALGAAFFAGVPLAEDTGAAPELPPCATTPHRSVDVSIDDPGQWSFDYHVIWCVNEGEIEWTVPVVTHKVPAGSSCTWKGNEESQSPAENRTELTALAMAKFSCGQDDETASDVIAWGIVGVSPDGRSRVVDEGID